ncbi:MAG: methyltransferase domain-containing protein, partial [Myxococcales bacterium]|nr:methyltransferase domain-containing protein [Myxococcales bacterium]
GKRKESTSGLALTLVENFARRGRDVVVLRYDGVRNLGESYKDPDCREHGREAMRMTLSQGVEDLEATLDYIERNPEFTATAIIVVSFSLQAVIGRRVLFRDRGRRIRQWIAVNGAPYARDLIANAAGGVDYLGQHQRGVRFGPASILGVTSDADHFAADAVASGLAFAADAEREVPAIAAPITWILGRYDAWVDPAIVRGLMARPAKAARDVVELDCGHIPLNSDEAIQLFQSITRAIWRALEGEEIEAIFPPWREIVAVRNAEWRRTPRAPLPDKRTYWAEYLLGGGDHKISYDVLYACDEYLRFLDRQAELLGVEPGHRVADMGCGTGNFFARYFERRGGRRRGPIARLTLVDFVPAALATARRKLERYEQARELLAAPADARAISLELSPARSFRAFLAGEFYGYDPLKGTMRGLGDYSVEMWKAMDNWRLHDILRGRVLDDEDRSFLKESFPADEREVIVDVNRICRWILGRVEANDLSREGRRRVASGAAARFHDLRFARLESRDPEALERLPFADGSFDRLVSSLVLSYLDNPLETLREFHRCLAPGGRLVVSSMRPDVDMSRIYQNLLRRLERGDAVAIPDGISRAEFIDDLRAFLSSAAFLLTLAEEGHFAFFSRDELRHLVERAGFRRVETFEAFGDPPQAYVTVGYR